MRRSLLPPAGLAVAVLLAADALGAQARYVAPTNESVFSTTEQGLSDSPEHRIYIENRSTVSVTVFSVSLTQCENVKARCGPRGVKLRIPPGRRTLATRVEPANRERGFGYYFNFSWNADSTTTAALAVLANGGVARAQEQLAGMRRADSLDRAGTGPRGPELTREAFAALAGRALALRAVPDSLLLAPGERTSIERLGLVVVDSQGVVLGRTRAVRWQVPSGTALQFVQPDQLVARAPGRAVLRFQLGDDAQQLVQRPVAEVEVPVRVAYPVDPHAPTYAGVARDADANTPLACAAVALEDSAANVVARGRTDAAGGYRLPAPRPGTYRVRVEAHGWSPAYGPAVAAGADETPTQALSVRFTEQLLRGIGQWADPDDIQHATPAAVATGPVGGRAGTGAPIVGGVTLGGSASTPILGIVGRAPAGSAWMQFVVDSTGRVDLGSLQLTPGTSAAGVASVRATLPRVRFSPARAAGRPTCELLRMQVNFRAP